MTEIRLRSRCFLLGALLSGLISLAAAGVQETGQVLVLFSFQTLLPALAEIEPGLPVAVPSEPSKLSELPWKNF